MRGAVVGRIHSLDCIHRLDSIHRLDCIRRLDCLFRSCEVHALCFIHLLRRLHSNTHSWRPIVRAVERKHAPRSSNAIAVCSRRFHLPRSRHLCFELFKKDENETKGTHIKSHRGERIEDEQNEEKTRASRTLM